MGDSQGNHLLRRSFEARSRWPPGRRGVLRQSLVCPSGPGASKATTVGEDVVPVAVIGAGGAGAVVLQALRQIGAATVVGVADRDPAVAAEAGQAYGVVSYTDNRSLLAEARPRVVFLCVPPAAGAELVGACAKRGIHVCKAPPLGRSLAEGVALVSQMEQAGLKLAVDASRRFAGSYRRAGQLRGRLGEVFLGRAHYLFNWGPRLGWRGDKATAGGGALLELGYPPIDLLVWLLGVPEEVYGLTAAGHRPAEAGAGGEVLPPYDTDDTAAAILRFARGCMATVVATRASGPVSEELTLHGRGGSLTVNSDSCLLRDPDGNVLDQLVEPGSPVEAARRAAEGFLRAVAADARSWDCSGRENLLPLAVIEAIYLSDRTCHPESPARLLRTHGLSVADCLPRGEPSPGGPSRGEST